MLNRVFSAIEAIKSVISRATSHIILQEILRPSRGWHAEVRDVARKLVVVVGMIRRIQVGIINKLARGNISTVVRHGRELFFTKPLVQCRTTTDTARRSGCR